MVTPLYAFLLSLLNGVQPNPPLWELLQVGDVERSANLRNGVALLIEIKGNTQLLAGEGFWPASSSSPAASRQRRTIGPWIHHYRSRHLEIHSNCGGE
jgi:hypothetical protein